MGNGGWLWGREQWNGLPGLWNPRVWGLQIVKFSSSEWLSVWSCLREGGVRELQREGPDPPNPFPKPRSLPTCLPSPWGRGSLPSLLCFTFVMHSFTRAAEMIEIFRHNRGSLIGSSGKPRCLDQLKNNNHLPCRGGFLFTISSAFILNHKGYLRQEIIHVIGLYKCCWV
jgi:hypothetical protein